MMEKARITSDARRMTANTIRTTDRQQLAHRVGTPGPSP